MNTKLWYNKPPKNGMDYLPMGNGKIGAMVGMGVEKEQIYLNYHTLWSGFPTNSIKSGVYHKYQQVRELVLEQKNLEAQKIVQEELLGNMTAAFLPMAKLNIDYNNESHEYEHYSSQLDMESAIVTCSTLANGNKVERECFTSYPHNALLYKQRSENPRSGRLTLESEIRYTIETDSSHNILYLKGIAPRFVCHHKVDTNHPYIYGDTDDTKGMRFCVAVKVKGDGNFVFKDKELIFENCKELDFCLVEATSFNGRDKHPYTHGIDEMKEIQHALESVGKCTYNTIKEEHSKDFGYYFNRVDLQVSTEESYEHLPVDERRQKGDTSLMPSLFQYGRYLFISSNREDSNPCNLQGIWNYEILPYWRCGYTTNINLQMNYWLVDPCNLSELFTPLVDLVSYTAKRGEVLAKEYYKSDGYVIHHNTDLWGTPDIAGRSQWRYEDCQDVSQADCYGEWEGSKSCMLWPYAGPWLCNNIYEHYLYTNDREFLEKQCYPLLKGAAIFSLQQLIEVDNNLVTCPSISPENSFVFEGKECSIDYGTTSDNHLMYDIFTNTLEAAETLGVDEELQQKLRVTLNQLPPIAVGDEGQILEWSKDYDEAEPGHRHYSHLIGVYPVNRITQSKNAEYLENAEISLRRRLKNNGGGTGWSLAWALALFARFQKPDDCHTIMKRFITDSVYNNLLDLHPPLNAQSREVFQIDGNFGFTSAVAEMLVQSHNDYIELLPSIPMEWHEGSISGLKARGGLEISFKWNKEGIYDLHIKGMKDQDASIKIKYKETEIEMNSTGQDLILHRLEAFYCA